MRYSFGLRQLTKTNDNKRKKLSKVGQSGRSIRHRRMLSVAGPFPMIKMGNTATPAGKAEDCGPSPVNLVLTSHEVCVYLGISDRLLYKLLKSGEIAGERLRGQWYIPKAAFFDRFGWPSGEPDLSSGAPPALPIGSTHEAAADAQEQDAVLKQPVPELMTPNQVQEHYGIFAGTVRDACKLWLAGDRVNGLQCFLDKGRFKVRPRWLDDWMERRSGGPTSNHAA